MISKIYFDLDGVLADFDCGVEEIAGINRNGANANSNVNDDDMWLAIAKVPNFYSKLELMPRAKTLFDTVYKMYGESVDSYRNSKAEKKYTYCGAGQGELGAQNAWSECKSKYST